MAFHRVTLPSSAFRALRGWFLPDDAAYDLPAGSTGPSSAKVRLSAVQWNTRGLSVELRSGSWVALEGETVLDYLITVSSDAHTGVIVEGDFVNQSNLATASQRIYAARDANARTVLQRIGDAQAAATGSIIFNFPDPPAGASNLYVGSQKVVKVYLGENEVDAMYLGDTRIY